jgi:MtN3 and saliva related transmembrane protein
MMPEVSTFVGAVAAIASTTSFLPQAVKIIRTRDTQGISASMYAVTVAGFMLWTTYGILLGAWPLIASNGISLLLSAFILLMKLLPRSQKEKVAEAIQPIVGPH